jgi:hypothetical protein
MANRRLEQFRLSAEKQVVDLYAVVTIGATGEPTLTRAKNVASIARNSAGQYTIVLDDVYNQLIGIDVMFYAGTSAAAAPMVVLESNSISTTKTFIIQCRAIDNSTATDPADGEIMYLHIALRNSSI